MVSLPAETGATNALHPNLDVLSFVKRPRLSPTEHMLLRGVGMLELALHRASYRLRVRDEKREAIVSRVCHAHHSSGKAPSIQPAET
jgi:hypothetical protein